jgi:ELWxxDGT repeat protein
LFFSAYVKQRGAYFFFRSDGSRNGTFRLSDSTVGGPGLVLGDRFLFVSQGLWATDGSAEGTGLITPVSTYDINGPCHQPVVARGLFFFGANDGQHGYELWASDGTAEGTRMVRDIDPGPDSSFPYRLTAVGDLAAFEASDRVHNVQPWLSDGTADGTRIAADLYPVSSPEAFTVAGGHIFFLSTNELWVLTGGP